jgi:hypothetical protein
LNVGNLAFRPGMAKTGEFVISLAGSHPHLDGLRDFGLLPIELTADPRRWHNRAD